MSGTEEQTNMKNLIEEFELEATELQEAPEYIAQATEEFIQQFGKVIFQA